MKRIISAILILIFAFIHIAIPLSAAQPSFDIASKSAILMDFTTGEILYDKNATEALPPASVTKIMTLLLIMEAIDSGKLMYDDMISVSSYAASMGGSQVYLEEGESMRVDDLLKSIVIASGNDAAVAMAEAVAGSEEFFVKMMNDRARELGMINTTFENVTGLDDDVTSHLTSAKDIAIMSRELMKHEKIFDYSTVWMDSIRNGEFGLTNTNRLIRFYNGATGLKTGSTGKAGFCISATAKRDDLHLIAVIMGAESRDIRNEAAKALLDYGFANYSLYKSDGGEAGEIPVKGGTCSSVMTEYDGFEVLVDHGASGQVKKTLTVNEEIKAPVKKGDVVGSVKYILNGEEIGKTEVKVSDDVPEISYLQLLGRMISCYFLK